MLVQKGYYCSGMESKQLENWSHPICRKIKVTPSSKLSIVNIQITRIWRRLHSPLVSLFQVQVDRWIPKTLQILCFSETIHHLYICRWNWIIVQGVSCLLWRDFVQTPAQMSIKNKSASNGAQLVPIVMPIVCWNNRPPNATKTLSIRYSSIFMTSASENFCGASEWFRTKYVSL